MKLGGSAVASGIASERLTWAQNSCNLNRNMSFLKSSLRYALSQGVHMEGQKSIRTSRSRGVVGLALWELTWDLVSPLAGLAALGGEGG